MMSGLSNDAKKLIADAYDVGGGQIADYHVHIVSDINNNRFSVLNPILYLKTKVLMNSSKVDDPNKLDEQYIARLLSLVKNVPENTQFYIFALDAYWEKSKESNVAVTYSFNKEKTDLYISNDYVMDLAEALNKETGSKRFVPVISVHPYRPNAAAELESCYKKGARFVKWLPNAMNIDPRTDDEEYKVFYKKMHDLDMVLISHTGWEESINVADKKNQAYGFPRYLEKALDAGVTVIMAHCGGDDKLKVDGKTSHQSFMDMMKEAANKPNWHLYGDISALTIEKNFGHLKDIIENIDKEGFKNKIVYGSDYPLPAAYFFYPIKHLIEKGYLNAKLREPLEEIFNYNPLVFDFVLKRNIKHPISGKKLPAEAFKTIF